LLCVAEMSCFTCSRVDASVREEMMDAATGAVTGAAAGAATDAVTAGAVAGALGLSGALFFGEELDAVTGTATIARAGVFVSVIARDSFSVRAEVGNGVAASRDSTGNVRITHGGAVVSENVAGAGEGLL
jgi:hypothetical protein